jgi:hypothetical protein
MSAKQRVAETVEALRASHPTCKVIFRVPGGQLPRAAAERYLRDVGDVHVVAQDRNRYPQRTVLLLCEWPQNRVTNPS